MRQLVGGLAGIAAVLAVLVAVSVVPRLTSFAESPSRRLRVATWGAFAFFIGCAATNIGIANELIRGDRASAWSNSDLALFLVPPVAQVLGGLAFVVIAFRHLVGSAVPRDVARRLHDAEDRLHLALDASGLGTWEFDLSTRAFALQFDAAASTWTTDDVRDAIHPDDRAMVEEHAERALDTGRFDVEFRLDDAPGAPGRWIAATGRLSRDDKGEPSRFIGTVVDATEHRTAQLERVSLERQLQHAQRLEAIGRLAGGVAHDFNNLLQVINGYVELAQLCGDDEGDATRRGLDAIADAGRRGATLTNQLLAFSRDATGEAVRVDVNDAVQSAVTLLQRLIGDDIRVVVSLSDDAGQVVIDPHQIGQIIMNLGLNARDAMPAGGLLTIETGPVDIDEHTVADGIEPGSYTMVAVSDTGVGMTHDVRDRLFEPFFTTKPADAGTGLGLPIVHGILQRAGGIVTVYSEPGEGAAFKVYLPRHDVPAETSEATTPEYAVGDARVLVVEDDPAVRELLETVLGRLGYAVTSMAGPDEAMSIAELDHQLLVTDVMMPTMTGPQLVEHLRDRQPDLNVLYISGYTGTAMIERSILGVDDAFLPKPFTVAALARRVGALLDGHSMT